MADITITPKPLTLGQRQELFAECYGKLLVFASSKGYKMRLGDVWAKPRIPKEHKDGSNHFEKLAGDINLVKDGKLLDKTEDHKELGDYWESLNPLCRWGGRYQDGNHYEIMKQGEKR